MLRSLLIDPGKLFVDQVNGALIEGFLFKPGAKPIGPVSFIPPKKPPVLSGSFIKLPISGEIVGFKLYSLFMVVNSFDFCLVI